jgi:hypothetical protein
MRLRVVGCRRRGYIGAIFFVTRFERDLSFEGWLVGTFGDFAYDASQNEERRVMFLRSRC